MRRAIPILLAAACGISAPHLPPEGDALILQKVLDGTLGAEDGFVQVARSGGWPIATSKGYLFALTDQGNGPYTVSGSFGGAMMGSNHGVAWALVPIAAPDGATYQFATRGGSSFADPFARRFAYSGSDELSVVAAQGAHFERWLGIGDASVAPRSLRVRVPAQNPTHILYVHDGQNIFTSARAFGGWFLQDAAGPATLVVGIDNTAARFDEYTHVPDVIGNGPTGGKGAAYADFVMLTVRPFIEARYGKLARSGVMGSSLGGLISLYQALRHPGAWDFVASLSGTVGWGSIGAGVHNKTVIELYSALSACPAGTFYLDSGGGPGSGCVDSDNDGIRDDAPDAADNSCENMQMKEVLQALACSPHYFWADGAQHNEAAWRARAPAILALFESL